MLFRGLRRNEKKMAESEVLELLKGRDYGILSIVGSDGYPYGVPLNYVYMNGSIYFHGASEGHKHINIQQNNRASFCIHGDTEVIPGEHRTRYQSVIIFGQIDEVDQREKRDALVGFIQKYMSEHMEKGLKLIGAVEHRTKVLKMSIIHISGKEAKYKSK